MVSTFILAIILLRFKREIEWTKKGVTVEQECQSILRSAIINTQIELIDLDKENN